MSRSLGARLARPKVIGVGAVVAAFGGVAAFTLAPHASADSVSVSLTQTCALSIGGTADLTVPLTTSDDPDPVTAGGMLTLTISSGAPQAALPVNVVSTTITTPIPAGLTPGGIEFKAKAGTTPNFTGSGSVTGGNLVVKYTSNDAAGSPVASAVMPDVIAHSTVTEAAGSTITWAAPTSIVSEVSLGGTKLTATCTPKADSPKVLNTTKVNAAPTTTTTTKPTTTTTKATTTSTAKPTTTTTAKPSTTTTAKPSTTTTAKPSTTTTAKPSTTSTAKPTTTTKHGDHEGHENNDFFRFLLWLLRHLFGMGGHPGE